MGSAWPQLPWGRASKRFCIGSSTPGEDGIALMPKHLVHGLQARLQAGSALRLRQRLVLQLPESIVTLLHKCTLGVSVQVI